MAIISVWRAHSSLDILYVLCVICYILLAFGTHRFPRDSFGETGATLGFPYQREPLRMLEYCTHVSEATF